MNGYSRKILYHLIEYLIMELETRNPYNGEIVKKIKVTNENEALEIFKLSRANQKSWARSLDDRVQYMKNQLIPEMNRGKEELAQIMSQEMGKPITQSRAEIEKTINMIEYFASHAHEFLSDENVATEASRSYISFEPLGVIYLIMPWNYPLWQVARAAIPAMLSGNTVILKHASIVSGSSKKIEEIFATPNFRSIFVKGSSALNLIRHSDGVSFTGSTDVGMQIYMEAAKHIKKVVLELGGSDPFIVLESADIRKAAKNAALGRLQNNGQSCIASKRFIVDEKIYSEFHSELEEAFRSVSMGDQMDPETYLGPVSSDSQSDILLNQIEELRKLGSVSSYGEVAGNLIPPTIVDLRSTYSDEVFGPVALLKKFSTKEEALAIANGLDFGLGASIWGEPSDAEEYIRGIEAGMVYVNKIVASDPRLPFGGIKRSGIGRELSRHGMLEFTNKKTVWIQGP